MLLKLDIRDESAVRLFSELLVNLREPLSVEIDEVDFCPNRIVPVVALADLSCRGGGKIGFQCPRGTAAEVATAGFSTSRMNPDPQIDRPFGRVWRFDSGDELGWFVNSCEHELNRSVRLAKGVRLCFSWCLNEIMDNVLTHSARGGKAFGYVMVQYVAKENLLKACVFDAGIGLKKSFEGSKYSPETSTEAIRLAVMRNVTSGNGQGNGLFGLKRLVGQSPDGRLHIRSADAEYLYDPSRNLENARESWSIAGYDGTTTIDFQMKCDGELSFADVFPEAAGLTDFWAENRESSDGRVVVKISEVVNNCGSRSAGREMRTLVENLIEADGRRVVIDFCGMENCSSGFVDELLGKLLEKYGFVAFSQLVSFINVQGIVALLINHSIAQRMAAMHNEAGKSSR
jgi:hypothetical protein